MAFIADRVMPAFDQIKVILGIMSTWAALTLDLQALCKLKCHQFSDYAAWNVCWILMKFAKHNALVQGVNLTHITPLKAHLVWKALWKALGTSCHWSHITSAAFCNNVTIHCGPMNRQIRSNLFKKMKPRKDVQLLSPHGITRRQTSTMELGQRWKKRASMLVKHQANNERFNKFKSQDRQDRSKKRCYWQILCVVGAAHHAPSTGRCD